MASSLGTKLGPKKQEAIEALLRPGSVEDVARQINVPTKKLSLWMKDPEFMAAYRAAKRAECRQSMAYLGQGATQILKSMLYIMYHSKKPALHHSLRQLIGALNSGDKIVRRSRKWPIFTGKTSLRGCTPLPGSSRAARPLPF